MSHPSQHLHLGSGLAPLLALLLLLLGGHAAAEADPEAPPAEDTTAPEEEEAPVDRPTLIAELIEVGLESEDDIIRGWALRAAALHGTAHRAALVRDMEHARPEVRVQAALALIEANHRVRDAEALLSAELASADATFRTRMLDRSLAELGVARRAAVLRGALGQVEDDAALRQILSWIARQGGGEVYAVLVDGARVEDAARRAHYVEPARRAARSEGLRLAEALISQRDAARQLEGLEIVRAVGGSAAMETAQPLLRSSHAEVAQQAGLYLGRRGDTGALAAVRDLALNSAMDESARIEALQVLRDRGAQLLAFSQLQEVLEESGRSQEFRMAVYEAMGATAGEDAIARLRELEASTFADDRVFGIAGLGYSGRRDVVPLMIEVMNSRGAEMIRMAGIRALGRLGGDEAAQSLSTALRTESVVSTRAELIRALGDTGSPDAAQQIGFELQRSAMDEAIILAALEALGRLGNPETAPMVQNTASQNRSATARWKASIVLLGLDREAGETRLLAQLDRPPSGFEADLADLPSDLRTRIDRRLLTSSTQSIREDALFRVRNREGGGLDLLREMVREASQQDVRRTAIAAVTAAADPADLEIFRDLTDNRDRTIRLQAWAAIAAQRDSAHEELLADALQNTDVAVRLIAALGLLRL